MDPLEKLQESELPPYEAFFSQLKNTNISREEYDYRKEIRKTKHMNTMGDFLAWYNDLDLSIPYSLGKYVWFLLSLLEMTTSKKQSMYFMSC